MIIERMIDIEDTVREALSPYITTYCRPLPKDFTVPSILVTHVGGDDEDSIDDFAIVLDARAETDAEANETLRNAVGILKKVAQLQTTELRHVTVNSSGSWGTDPVRPDLAMFSARLSVVAHTEIVEV